MVSLGNHEVFIGYLVAPSRKLFLNNGHQFIFPKIHIFQDGDTDVVLEIAENSASKGSLPR